jgi:hypothetical protein
LEVKLIFKKARIRRLIFFQASLILQGYGIIGKTSLKNFFLVGLYVEQRFLCLPGRYSPFRDRQGMSLAATPGRHR